jgi:hypothetical protein
LIARNLPELGDLATKNSSACARDGNTPLKKIGPKTAVFKQFWAPFQPIWGDVYRE